MSVRTGSQFHSSVRCPEQLSLPYIYMRPSANIICCFVSYDVGIIFPFNPITINKRMYIHEFSVSRHSAAFVFGQDKLSTRDLYRLFFKSKVHTQCLNWNANSMLNNIVITCLEYYLLRKFLADNPIPRQKNRRNLQTLFQIVLLRLLLLCKLICHPSFALCVVFTVGILGVTSRTTKEVCIWHPPQFSHVVWDVLKTLNLHIVSEHLFVFACVTFQLAK